MVLLAAALFTLTMFGILKGAKWLHHKVKHQAKSEVIDEVLNHKHRNNGKKSKEGKG